MAGLQGKSDTGIQFPEISVTSAALAGSEPGKSQPGQIILEPKGVEVMAADDGPGTPDVALAMQNGLLLQESDIVRGQSARLDAEADGV